MNIKYTRLAQAVLSENRAAFEEHARGRLAEIFAAARKHAQDPDDLSKSFLFLTLEYDGHWFIIRKKDDAFLIDTATFVKGPVLPDGPFKGKTVLYPQADSEDREDA